MSAGPVCTLLTCDDKPLPNDVERERLPATHHPVLSHGQLHAALLLAGVEGEPYEERLATVPTAAKEVVRTAAAYEGAQHTHAAVSSERTATWLRDTNSVSSREDADGLHVVF